MEWLLTLPYPQGMVLNGSVGQLQPMGSAILLQNRFPIGAIAAPHNGNPNGSLVPLRKTPEVTIFHEAKFKMRRAIPPRLGMVITAAVRTTLGLNPSH